MGRSKVIVSAVGDDVAGRFDERHVEVLVELVLLPAHVAPCLILAERGSGQDRGQVEAAGLPVVDRAVDVEQLVMADRLVEGAEPELGEVLAHLFGDELHEVHDELGLAVEPLAQHRVLRRDADRAGVEVADAHHDAARDDERCGGEAELLRAQQRADDDVAAGLELAVDLHDDAVAHAVEHERLLGLGEAELPRRARVLERVERARAGAAVVAGDQDDVGQGLRRAGCDRADAGLAHELGVHPRLGDSRASGRR